MRWINLNRQGLWPVLIILLINSLLAIGVLILAFSKERKNKSTLIMLSCFILIVPLIGPIYILLGLLINRLTR